MKWLSLLLTMILVGCGQSGALFLPDDPAHQKDMSQYHG